MCCATFIAKYVLLISNLVFSLLGLAVVGVGIAGLVVLRDLQDILPVNIIPISLIVLGLIVFFIGFLGCCGAIRESRCMLIFYAIIVGLLLAGFIYLTVVILGHITTIDDTVHQWVVTAFNDNDLRPVFNVMEASFRCCGTTGPNSYIAINETLPTTCCANPGDNTCVAAAAFGGCGDMVGLWMESISTTVGVVLLVVIIVQSVAVIFALFLSFSISNQNKRRRNIY